MFNADPNKTFVPSKTVTIKPEVQTEYSCKGVNQIRFHIPSYIGFIDPQHLRLNCKAKMVTADGSRPRGMIHPDGTAGIWSCIRDIRVSDGTGRTELEMLSDLNVQTAQEWGFTQNDSINAKRELFEGMSMNTDQDQQLWFDAPDDWKAGGVAENPTATQLKLTAPIPCSGIIGQKAKNVFPLTATSGLRVIMNIEDFERSMVVSSDLGAGEAKDYNGAAGQNATGNYGELPGGVLPERFYLTYTTKATGAQDADTVDTTAGTGNDGVFDIEVATPADRGTGAIPQLENHATVEAKTDNNFAIDDLIYICKFDGTFPRCLGKVIRFEENTTAGVDRLKISYQANRANGQSLNTGGAVTNGYVGCDAGGNNGDSCIFFVSENRVNQVRLTNTQTARDSGGVEVLPALDIELSDVEIQVLQVEPPAGYVDNMLKQVNGKGVEMDYCTSTLYRGNIVNAQGLTSNLIPANQSRAYSILSVPLSQEGQTSLIESSLTAQYEQQKNYQWVFNGNLVPDRPIDLEKYSAGRNPVLHIMENEKAMENAKCDVRNLWNTEDRLLFGRALSRYGQVHDLQGKTTMLRVTYPNTVGDTVLLNNNVVHLNRMVISADGVEVIR